MSSWKEIAAYFGATDRTVQRWEQEEGLPVHRLSHRKRAGVYAYRTELEAWFAARAPKPAGTAPRFGRWWVVGLAAAILLATGGLLFSMRQPEAGPATWLELSLPAEADPLSVALSPDGRILAYVARDGQTGPEMLWIRRLDTGESRRLPRTEGAADPFWSPDGGSLGFFSGHRLMRVSLAGEPPRELARVARGEGASWGAGGDILYSPGNFDSLHKVAAGGGEAERVTEVAAAREENAHRQPTFLPDGRRFLYCARKGRRHALYLGSLGAEEGTYLTDVDSKALYLRPGRDGSAGELLYVREGVLVAREFDPDQPEALGKPRPVAEDVTYRPVEGRAGLALAANGTLAYHSAPAGERRHHLLWLDRDGTVLGRVATPKPLRMIALSPDGGRVR